MSNMEHRVFPGTTSSSSVIHFFFMKRDNEGVGTYVNFVSNPSIPALDVAFVNGRDSGPVKVSDIIELAKLHIENNGIASWYSPESGTIREALDRAFADFQMQMGSIAVNVYVLFDGQFGSVVIG